LSAKRSAARSQVNAAQDLSKVRAGSHDELFQADQPVLTGINLDSTDCDLRAPVAHRDAETWGIHLLDLAEQGLHPDYTVADGGRGLRAGHRPWKRWMPNAFGRSAVPWSISAIPC
jgi:hypothetical protein